MRYLLRALTKGIMKAKFSSLTLIVVIGLEVITGSLMVYSLRHLYRPPRINQGVASASALTAVQNAPVTADIAAASPIADTAENASDGLAPEVKMALSSVFGPLPAYAQATDYEVTEALVNLGRHLWYDPRLSSDQSMSCNTCHALENYGVDNMAASLGVNGTVLERNTPTVYNAALHIAQFWDGRSATVEEQAITPILAANEMGMLNADQVKATFSAIPGYQPLFEAAFPVDSDPVNLANIAIAIGAFERGLITPSRFDRFLQGDYTQLDEQEQRGMTTFVSLRCPSCHIGATLGGLSFKRIGEHEPYIFEDTGRYQVTGLETDKHVFKVPSLRNVAQTAPYLHNGDIETLDETIRFMVRHQLGKTVSDEEVADVVAFLNSLTGELPIAYIAKPELPDMKTASQSFPRDR